MIKHYLFAIAVCVCIICCKKDTSCENCIGENRSPIADAGIDQVITLPLNFVDLDGSKSSDPDNNIANYYWTKLSGPDLFTITNVTQAITRVTNLVQGTYVFELRVTDAGNNISVFSNRIAFYLMNHIARLHELRSITLRESKRFDWL